MCVGYFLAKWPVGASDSVLLLILCALQVTRLYCYYFFLNFIIIIIIIINDPDGFAEKIIEKVGVARRRE